MTSRGSLHICTGQVTHQNIGVHFPDDVVLRMPADLIVWTGLPEAMVHALYEHSVVEMQLWDGLGHFHRMTDKAAGVAVMKELEDLAVGTKDDQDDDEIAGHHA